MPVGFHRFEPVVRDGVATAPGNVTYPTRNFAWYILGVSAEAGLYLELSPLDPVVSLSLSIDPRFIFDAIARICSTPSLVR